MFDMKNVLFAVALVSVLLSGCAEHEQQIEEYVGGGERCVFGDFRIQLMIHEFHEDRPKDTFSLLVFLMSNTTERSGFPYELRIVSDYSGTSTDTAKISRLEMQVGDQPVVDLMGAQEEPTEISYVPETGPIALPLGDKLPFKEGQRVTVTLSVQPPGATKAVILTYLFEGRSIAHIYTSGDVINSV